MIKNLIVRGVTYEADIIRLTVCYEVLDEAALANIFTTLAESGINVDTAVQILMDGEKPIISLSIEKEEFAEALSVLESSKGSLGFSFADFEVGLAKVSVVGADMMTDLGLTARMLSRLSREGIQVKMVSTSEIKVTVIIPQDDMIRAANALYDEFQLVS